MSLNEKCAIGAALLNAEAADELCTLSEQDFTSTGHRLVYKIIKTLRKDNHPADLVTVATKLDHKAPVNDQYLVDCMGEVPAPSNYKMYIQGVREEAHRRNLHQQCISMANQVLKKDVDPIAIQQELIQALNKNLSTGSITSLADAFGIMLDSLNGGGHEGKERAYTGIVKFDRVTNGIKGGKLVVVGARPGVGKSAFALSAALATAKKGTAVLFVSLEMKEDEIAQRIVASEGTINSATIETQTFKDEELQKIVLTASNHANLPIFFDTRADTPEKIRRAASTVGSKNRLGLIIVDYMQLMYSGLRTNNRTEEVGQISRALKQLAMDLSTPVMALAQLNRESQRSLGGRVANRKPSLAEFRESGSIEQDADIAVLLWQPTIEGVSEEIQENIRLCKTKGGKYTLVEIEKHRGGETLGISTNFIGKYMRFENVPMREVNHVPWNEIA